MLDMCSGKEFLGGIIIKFATRSVNVTQVMNVPFESEIVNYDDWSW